MSVLLLSLLAAAPSVAIPGGNCVRIDDRTCTAYVDRLANQLGNANRVKVVTASDIAQVLGLERQKQLLGCSESSCVGELAGALGVDGVLSLSVTQSEKKFFVTVRIVRAKDSAVWATRSSQANDEPALFGELDALGQSLSLELSGAPAPVAKPNVVPWVVAGAGVGVVAVGLGLFFGVAKSTEADLLAKRIAVADVATRVSTGKTFEVISFAAIGVGAAAAVGGLVWALVLPKSPVVASVGLSSSSVGVSFEGRFP